MLLFLVLLIPVVIAIGCWYIFDEVSFVEMILHILIACAMGSGIYKSGIYYQTVDTEVWNGEVLGKDRIHDTYEEAYDCNCTTDDEGYETCSTCYETHYTVEWRLYTNIGDTYFDYLDSTSRRVYNTPDPILYTQCRPGQPASLEYKYTNYIQAVPSSILNNLSYDSDYLPWVPEYPRVYNIYQIDRVLDPSKAAPAGLVNKLNDLLDKEMKILGPEKEANVIVLFTDIPDPSFKHTVEYKWDSGNQNDIVVIISVDNSDYPVWVDVMTLAHNWNNEALVVELRERLMNTKLNASSITNAISEEVKLNFNRLEMEYFEHLKSQIKPPNWIYITITFVSIFLSLVLVIIFHRSEI